MPDIISADEIKTTLPHYSPDQSEAFHHESARLADKLFIKTLKTNPHKEVILLNGGTASGKTEFLSTHLINKQCIIFDATMTTELGAKNKLRQIEKSGKKPIIYAIIPDDLRRAFIAFLNRDRKFSDNHFYRTHCGSRKTLLWLTKEYPMIEINIIESSYTKEGKLQFSQLLFENDKQRIDYLISVQMSEHDILSYVNFLNE